MTKQTTITNIPEAIAALMALRSTMTQKELWDGFDQAREFLDREPARDWDAETDLKAAYEYGLDLLEMAHAAYVAEFRRTHPELYKAKQ